MDTTASEGLNMEADTQVAEVSTPINEDLLEIGNLSQTKGSLLGFISDTIGTDFRVG